MDSIKYCRFKTEDELLKSLLRSMVYDAYPKVSAIGGKKINPDIDVLEVRRVSPNQARLIGYEVKLMRFDRRSNGLRWSSFYSGIGQALLYLQNGVQRIVLVLGFHANVPADSFIDEFYDWLWEKKDFLKRILPNYVSVGVHLHEGASVSPIVEGEGDFYPSDEKVRLLSDELLQEKFTYDKRLRPK